MPDALFSIDGDYFTPSDLTRGGWSADAQHGSPPSGLLARAIENVSTAAPMQVVRFTIDLFRAVPLEPLRVETHILRQGLRIQVVEASLTHGDIVMGRATGLKIRTTEVVLPHREEEAFTPPPPPEQAEPLTTSRWHDDDIVRFHTHAIEIRTFDGSFTRPGLGVSWFRLGHDLVEGEPMSPFVRLATIADMSNGNSQALDPREFLYVNPDITLYAHRLPDGDWIGMRSRAYQHRSGIGLADSSVFDRAGLIGRISQAQVIDRHRPGR